MGKRPADKRPSTIRIGGDGKILHDRTDVLRKWRDYVGKLYQDGAQEGAIIVDDDRDPPY